MNRLFRCLEFRLHAIPRERKHYVWKRVVREKLREVLGADAREPDRLWMRPTGSGRYYTGIQNLPCYLGTCLASKLVSTGGAWLRSRYLKEPTRSRRVVGLVDIGLT